MEIINRQAKLMRLLAEASFSGRSLRKLAKQLGAPPSTTHRLLNSLAEIGMVTQSRETHNYRLGGELLRLAGAYLERISFADLVIPHLDALSARTGLVSFSAVREGYSVICTSVRAPREATNFYVRVGKILPVHASAAAKALVYDLPRDRLAPMIVNPHRFTDKTRVTLTELEEDLAVGRSVGYWECEEELEAGVWAAAAPVRANNGAPVVSLSILCQSNQLGGQKEKFLQALVDVASNASSEIGELLLTGEALEATT